MKVVLKKAFTVLLLKSLVKLTLGTRMQTFWRYCTGCQRNYKLWILKYFLSFCVVQVIQGDRFKKSWMTWFFFNICQIKK